MSTEPAAGRLGEAAALATAACWAGSALFFTAASRRLGSFRVNQIRLLLACTFLGGAVAVRSLFGGDLPSPGLRQGSLLLASGFVGLTLGDAALFRAFVLIGARRVLLVAASAPVFVALLAAPLLGERLGAVGIAGMAVTLAGIAWVIAERRDDDAPAGHVREGLVLAAIAAAGQAGGAILAKAGLGQAPPGSPLAEFVGASVASVDPLTGTFLRMLAGTAGLLAWAAPAGRLRGLFDGMSAPRARVAVVGGTLLGPTIGVWLSLVAFARTETAVAQTIMALTPILVLPAARAVFGERASPRAWIGAAVAVAGAALLAFRDRIVT